MGDLVNRPLHGVPIAKFKGQEIPLESDYQRFFDSLEQLLNDRVFGDGIQLKLTAKADLAGLKSPKRGMLRYITDEAGGEQPAFFDGTNWRRCTDRAIVS